MKKLLIVFFILPIVAFAQGQGEGEIEIQLIQSQNIDLPTGTSNVANITQIGQNNDAKSIQQQLGAGVNFSMINQQGSNNQGYINQSGSNLNASLAQISMSNSSNLWLIGNNLSISTSQNGVENSINAYVESFSGNAINSSLNQLGNQNTIDFAIVNAVGFNPGMDQTIGISQFGNNHSVTAQYQDFGAPTLNITQNPGYGGAGMSISVSTIPGFTYSNR